MNTGRARKLLKNVTNTVTGRLSLSLFLEELEKLEKELDEQFLQGLQRLEELEELEELERLGEVMLERLELELELEDDRALLLPPLLLAKAFRLIFYHWPLLPAVKFTVNSPPIKKAIAAQHKSWFFSIIESVKNTMLNQDY